MSSRRKLTHREREQAITELEKSQHGLASLSQLRELGLTNNTEYFVIDAGGGRVKLADTLEHAKAGTALPIAPGTGTAHKLARIDGDDEITFDPVVKRVELTIATDEAWVTGTSVVYNNGGGTSSGVIANRHGVPRRVGDLQQRTRGLIRASTNPVTSASCHAA